MSSTQPEKYGTASSTGAAAAAASAGAARMTREGAQAAAGGVERLLRGRRAAVALRDAPQRVWSEERAGSRHGALGERGARL